MFLSIRVYKGKKSALRAQKKPEDTTGDKVVPSQAETKENKPTTNKDCVGQVPSIFQSRRNQSKPRSPLSENPSMLIQEGNDSDGANLDTSRLRKDLPNAEKTESCESREQKPETACNSHATKEQTSDQVEQNVITKEKKVPTSKSRSRGTRKTGANKMEKKAPQNRKVTDFFPIRRSNRKTEAELKNEEHKHTDYLIENDIEEGMEVKHIEGKGRGVFASKNFKKGEFVVEYHGDLLELTEAKKREAEYALDPETGCYMYYFQYQSKTYCVDATKETNRLGRLINHSKSGNCQTRLHPMDGTPHLILVASRDISAEEELLYDYGDRSKASILAHPWLKH